MQEFVYRMVAMLLQRTLVVSWLRGRGTKQAVDRVWQSGVQTLETDEWQHN